jgi:hypothetical protein
LYKDINVDFVSGSKETAFLYAITSAGVVHVVAKACSSGNLTECNCDLLSQGGETPEGWKWGGCRYRYNFVMQILIFFTSIQS